MRTYVDRYKKRPGRCRPGRSHRSGINSAACSELVLERQEVEDVQRAIAVEIGAQISAGEEVLELQEVEDGQGAIAIEIGPAGRGVGSYADADVIDVPLVGCVAARRGESDAESIAVRIKRDLGRARCERRLVLAVRHDLGQVAPLAEERAEVVDVERLAGFHSSVLAL